MSRVLRASDVVVSTSSTEGMPGSLIEAALSGVPVVATDVGFVSDVVGPGGVLVHPEARPGDVASAVRGLTTRPISDNSAASMPTCHSWNAVVPTWMDVVAAVARDGSVGPRYRW